MHAIEGLHIPVRFAANLLHPGAPRVLYIEVTKRCNAFCGFCPYWKDKRRGELTDYTPIVEKFKPFSVTFTGGEPLLRRDLARLVADVSRLNPRPYTAVLTNGWLLSEERARALRDAGLYQLSISVDYVGEEHDRQRGLPGLYARIVERIPMLQALGFTRININTVIMESNLEHCIELAHLTARWGVTHSFSSYSSMKTHSDGELVRRRALDKLRATVEELKRLKVENGNIISSDWYLDRVPEYFENGGRYGQKCTSAGRKFFHVDPWGFVKICPEFEPFAHWTEVGEKQPAPHDCTSCWYGCRGENEVPMSLGRVREIAGPGFGSMISSIVK